MYHFLAREETEWMNGIDNEWMDRQISSHFNRFMQYCSGECFLLFMVHKIEINPQKCTTHFLTNGGKYMCILD